MDKCGAETGNLIVFDRDAEKTWDEKIFQRKENYRGRMIDIWGM
ncbi:conserved hypothetical protein [Candidatus Desulfarcum epimagneticum]|nr:conserved hypothetical protein [uncultured Desulfobacteraceae bacterium]